MPASADYAARLLVVDDEQDIALVMKMGLERHGFRVDALSSPAAALEKFKETEYDMAILDVRMPGMDGFTLYQKMREVKGKANIKACFLTAFDKEYYHDFKEKFGDLPDRCFMHKPVSAAELVRIINAELGLPQIPRR